MARRRRGRFSAKRPESAGSAEVGRRKRPRDKTARQRGPDPGNPFSDANRFNPNSTNAGWRISKY
eukprot:1205375-Lingulodinium_polyedra.AAC.1